MDSVKKHKFKIGDCVFAKVKGYSHWPAVIDSVDTASRIVKYDVTFYGTNDIGYSVKELDICSFLENKNKYGVAKANKKDFSKAMKEAESSLNTSGNTDKSFQYLSNALKTVETPSLASPTAFSSPLMDKCIGGKSTLTPIKSTTISCDKSVNTPDYLDLNVQLGALTEKCISNALDVKYLQDKISALEQQLKIKDSLITELQNKIDKSQQSHENICLSPKIRVDIGIQTNQEKRESETVKLNLDMYDKIKNMEDALCEAKLVISNLKKEKKISVGLTTETEPLEICEQVNTPKSNKPKWTIISDSQGRDLAIYLKNIIGNSHDICGHVQAGGYIENISGSASNYSNFKDYTKSDAFVLIAGSNNVSDASLNGAHISVHRYRIFLKQLVQTYAHTNLVISTIPYRYDLPSSSWENRIIHELNHEVRLTVNSFSNLFLLDLHLLPRHCYTGHGLHINRRGKKTVANQIGKLVANLGMDGTDRTRLTQPNLTPSKPASHNIYCSKNLKNNLIPSHLIKGGKISILDLNMYSAIDQLKNDPSVAFAHSISNDFNHIRHMSAGVAVVFRRKFGRPIRSDCIASNLARQRLPGGAAIYSLVTKDNYNDKPTLNNYNLAFEQLQSDFKSQGLKTLVCSVIGCVRDLVDPQDFAKNIVQFQKSTGASICIVSYGQNVAKRPLWKGLTHPQFLQKVAREINSILPLTSPTHPHHYDPAVQPVDKSLHSPHRPSSPHPSFSQVSPTVELFSPSNQTLTTQSIESLPKFIDLTTSGIYMEPVIEERSHNLPINEAVLPSEQPFHHLTDNTSSSPLHSVQSPASDVQKNYLHFVNTAVR